MKSLRIVVGIVALLLLGHAGICRAEEAKYFDRVTDVQVRQVLAENPLGDAENFNRVIIYRGSGRLFLVGIVKEPAPQSGL